MANPTTVDLLFEPAGGTKVQKKVCCFACGREDTILQDAFLIWNHTKQQYAVWPKDTYWCTGCLRETKPLVLLIQGE